MQILRPYQTDIVAGIWQRITIGHRRLLLVAPTGSGKTVISAAIIEDALRQHLRVIFLAHRRELIHQGSQKFFAAGLDHGVLLPDHPMRLHERLQVASIATLHARAVRSSTIEFPPADMLIVDEAHHARAETYQSIIGAYPGAIIIGLTATPCRGDGRGLGGMFDSMVECPSVAELIAAGYLVPTVVYAPTAPDLRGVRVEHGDYAEGQLAERMNTTKLVGDVVEHWFKLADRRRTVVFATGIRHSLHIRDEFLKAGVLAEHIDGTTPSDERDTILKQLASGAIDLVTNAMVLTEGWDSPEVSCLVLARPTKSIGLYRQMVGRILRPAPGKANALVLDHAGATLQHGFAEDPISWPLTSDDRATNRSHSARGSSPEMPALTTCPECTAVRLAGKPCGACGWRPQEKPKAVVFGHGELGRVDRDGTVQANAVNIAEQVKFHRQLIWIGRERGYKAGWPAAMFKEKFGSWPPTKPWESPPAEEPTPAVRAWVRSRQIAYAKSRDRAA